MSRPMNLFEMWMHGWMKMCMGPWQSDVNIEPSALPSNFEGVHDYTIKRISNWDYEEMSKEQKLTIQEEYRMVSLDDPNFYGFWMLIPKDGDCPDDCIKHVTCRVKNETKTKGSGWTEYGL